MPTVTLGTEPRSPDTQSPAAHAAPCHAPSDHALTAGGGAAESPVLGGQRHYQPPVPSQGRSPHQPPTARCYGPRGLTWRRHHPLPLLEQAGLEAVAGTEAVGLVPGHQLLHRLQDHAELGGGEIQPPPRPSQRPPGTPGTAARSHQDTQRPAPRAQPLPGPPAPAPRILSTGPHRRGWAACLGPLGCPGPCGRQAPEELCHGSRLGSGPSPRRVGLPRAITGHQTLGGPGGHDNVLQRAQLMNMHCHICLNTPPPLQVPLSLPSGLCPPRCQELQLHL